MSPSAGSCFRRETSGVSPNPMESTGVSRHGLPRRYRMGGCGNLRNLAGLEIHRTRGLHSSSMRLRSLILVTVFAATLPGARCGAADAIPASSADAHGDALAASARRAGLRVLEGDHLVLVTDRPARAGDGVEDLPRIFDEAWTAWCRHYGLDPDTHRDWRAFGCLIVDRERFRAAGLLPDTIPDFANGHCHGHRFWMADQSNPAYRRHLLLHEGVHAFTLTLRSLDTPPWYTEGIAECLATHRLDDGGTFVSTPLPPRADDVEQLGRIEKIRALRAAGECPGLEDIFTTRGADHRDLSAYAGSWATVTMLSRHPRHAAAFTAAERGALDANFNRRLMNAASWDGDQAERDFDAFTDEIDYGYDFGLSGIDWAPGKPLPAQRTIAVAAKRGWQNSGWSLRKGARYSLEATGRCTIGVLEGTPPAQPLPLETEADGISLRWYRGRPLGTLLVAQWVEHPEGGDRPRFIVLANGRRGTFTAVADGTVFCKLNDPPGELADNDGQLTVVIASE
jgi:hypothetical protein